MLATFQVYTSFIGHQPDPISSNWINIIPVFMLIIPLSPSLLYPGLSAVSAPLCRARVLSSNSDEYLGEVMGGGAAMCPLSR